MIKGGLKGAVNKIHRVRYKTVPYLRNYGLKSGLVTGDTNYSRFIVLGRSRVGSNLLRGLLNSHSQIVVFGELFQNRDEIGWALPGYSRSGGTRNRFLHDPVQFLDKDTFNRFPPNIAAVGFKIFYYHAQQEEWQPVWTYLRAQKDIKVIHIKRRNILKTHLSRKRAMMTDVWVATAQKQDKEKQIALDYEECFQDFDMTRQSENQFDAIFSDHERIEIVYEQLAANYQAEMKLVQDFLDVKQENLVPETQKQSHRPLSQAISNYSELKEQFVGTPWLTFFDE